MAKEHEAIDVFPHTNNTTSSAKPAVSSKSSAKPSVKNKPASPSMPVYSEAPAATDMRVFANIQGEVLVSDLVAKVACPLDVVLDSIERLAFQKKVKVFRQRPTSPLSVITI